MAKSLFVDNWKKHQHYKDRNPPWIKLATNTFQSYEFSRLQDASKLLAICIWTLASRSEDGSVPHDFAYIKSQCCLGELVEDQHLTELIERGFLSASNPLSTRKQSACLETETETEERRGEVDKSGKNGISKPGISKNGTGTLPETSSNREPTYSPEPPENSELMVSMLVAAHPRNESPVKSEFEAMEAIVRETPNFGGTQQAYAYLLERTELYKKLTAKWPEEERDWIVAAHNFFAEKRYKADEKLWMKFDAAAPAAVKPGSTMREVLEARKHHV